ncbi:MAG: hypothetical protein ACKO96_24665 [Flammeovirgaceae bacterium]
MEAQPQKTTNTNTLTIHQLNVLSIESFVLVGIYLLVSVPVVINIHRYLYKQQLWKVALTSTFYALALLVLTLRVTAYTQLGVSDA